MRSGIGFEQPRVLLVDDNEEMLEICAAVLSRGFVIVGSAKDGRAALRAADSLRPDVIVLDISMPGMSGLEVAARLKAAGIGGGLGVSHDPQRRRDHPGRERRRSSRLRPEVSAGVRPPTGSSWRHDRPPVCVGRDTLQALVKSSIQGAPDCLVAVAPARPVESTGWCRVRETR